MRRTGDPEPQNLGQLRLAVLGKRLAEAIGAMCTVKALPSDDWCSSVESGQFHCLVVEGRDLGPGCTAELASLLRACRRADLPRVLWIVGSDFERNLLEHAARFTRVFTVDPGHVPDLQAAGVPDPVVLPAAVSLPVDVDAPHGTASRPRDVVRLGGGYDDLPLLARERLLRSARVIVDMERGGNRCVTPAAALDAIAAGAAIVTSHNYTARVAFRDLMPTGVREDDLEKVIRELLDDDEQREQRVGECRKIIAFNHTYAHRLATIMSSLGYTLVPDAPRVATHS